MNKRQYDDIILLPHHVSPVHPQMKLSDRAAQFAPFAALTGHAAAIQEEARLTDAFADLEEDSLEMLNQQLERLQEHLGEYPEVTITFFQPDEKKAGGAYHSISGTVKKLDFYDRRIIMTDGTQLPMRWIIQMDGKVFDR